jgi:hypothetical protein
MMSNAARMILNARNGEPSPSNGHTNLLCHTLIRSARDEKLFGGEADPMGAGGDGALESDSNFIGSGEEAVFNSP